jgi:hypothetical protein
MFSVSLFFIYIYMSISIIVIYSTIYLMFIESCIYWSSTVIHWGVCFLSNIRFRIKKKERNLGDTIEYLDYLWKKNTFSVSFLFFSSSSPSSTLGFLFFYIENISNNLQFSELELVSDHTRAGGRTTLARIRLVSLVWTLDLCAYNWKDRDKTHIQEKNRASV